LSEDVEMTLIILCILSGLIPAVLIAVGKLGSEEIEDE